MAQQKHDSCLKGSVDRKSTPVKQHAATISNPGTFPTQLRPWLKRSTFLKTGRQNWLQPDIKEPSGLPLIRLSIYLDPL